MNLMLDVHTREHGYEETWVPVVVNRACLGYVVSDSDLSVWVGNANDPFNNHLALSDTLLAGLTRDAPVTLLPGGRRSRGMNSRNGR